MKELKRTEDEVDQILEELKPLEEELRKVFLLTSAVPIQKIENCIKALS